MSRGLERAPRVIRDDIAVVTLGGSDVLYGNAQYASVKDGKPIIYGNIGHLMIHNGADPLIYGEVFLLQHEPEARWRRVNGGLTGTIEQINS